MSYQNHDPYLIQKQSTLLERTEPPKCAKSSRVYGADNAFIGWHIHPYGDPEQHVPSSEVPFEDFLNAIEKQQESKQSG